MAEGIRATITADTTSFVKATQNATDSAKRFQAAVQGAAAGTLKFTPAVDGAVPRLNRLDSSVKKTTKNFRVMKGAVGQLGFQIQDIAVQLQGGQNAMLVFGQQGSQIASIFGPGGAVIGAVLAVAAAIGTALVGSLGAATEKTSELVKETNELLTAMQSISLLDLNDRLFEQAQVVDKVKDSLAAVTLKIKEQEAATVKGSDIALAGAAARLNALKVESKELGTLLRLEESRARLLGAEQSKLVQAGRPGGLGVAPTGEDDLAKAADQAAANELRVEKARIKAQAAAFIARFEMEQAQQLQIETIEQESLQRRRDTMRDFLEGQRGMIRFSGSAIVELVRANAGQQQGIMAGAFASILSSTASHNKKAFKLNKAFAITDAVISAYQGISKTLAAYPFPLSAAMAAAQGAIAFAQVRAIQSQSFGGGGGAGGAAASLSGVPTPATPAAAPAADPTLVNITLEGEVFGRDQVRGLIGQINEAVDDGFKLRFT
jgi:uncharacterized coiled-coil protein SlyX